MIKYRIDRKTVGLLLLLMVASCGRAKEALPALHLEEAPKATAAAPASTALLPTEPTPTTAQAAPGSAEGLSAGEAATLDSLEKVDEFPLYTMRYYGDYAAAGPGRSVAAAGPAWGCSLFAALGNPDKKLYGRNFDWEDSPALLLFTDPPDGYASASMVDISYLGFAGEGAGVLLELPLAERRGLLEAPLIPFDGMNEAGLAVGMAAVPPGDVAPDPAKPAIGSIGVIREMLDHAADVDQAVGILQGYNVEVEGSVPIHYLLADRSGRAVLVEFYQGQVVLLRNEQPWHLATNSLLAAAGESPLGQCSRYDKINERLTRAEGRLSGREALDLLQEVSQAGTQWSVVYDLGAGEVAVAMGRQYGRLHTFPVTGSAARP